MFNGVETAVTYKREDIDLYEYKQVILRCLGPSDRPDTCVTQAKRADIFHPNFDELVSTIGYLRITYTAQIPENVYRTSGRYENEKLFGDTVAEIGFVVPNRFKRLTVTGTDPARMRTMINAIRRGEIEPCENWESQSQGTPKEDLQARIQRLEARVDELERKAR